MRRNMWGALAVVVVASGGVLVARAGPTRTRAGGTPTDASAVVTVGRRDIGTEVKATGVIRPRVGAEVRVGSRVSGVVRRLYVQIGDTVARGGLLAELDDHDLVARRDEAAAALREADADLAYARADVQRRRALGAAGAIAPAELDVAERAYAMAEQRAVGARASVAFAAAQVGYARIVAPIGGVVASVATQEGETVAASFASPTFLTLIDPSRLEVWSYVDETDIGRVKLGQAARFTVDTYGDEAFAGRVTAVHPKPEIRDNVVDYVTVVRFDAPRDRVLRPEMTTTVHIALAMRERALAVPIRAVRREGGRAYVLAVRGTMRERRWVTTGLRDERYWEILDGLRDGDRVIVGETPPPNASTTTGSGA